MSRLRRAAASAIQGAADFAETRLGLDVAGMSRRDRQRWAACRTLADMGECVVAWLNGELRQTPAHGAPPLGETIPLIPALTAANRAGFTTDGSQRGDAGCCADVYGYLHDDALAALRNATRGTRLSLSACRGGVHGRHAWRQCPREDRWWVSGCPRAAQEIRAAWFAHVRDPEPGRNDILWPVLLRFANERNLS